MKQIAAAKSRKTLKQSSKILHHLTDAYRDYLGVGSNLLAQSQGWRGRIVSWRWRLVAR